MAMEKDLMQRTKHFHLTFLLVLATLVGVAKAAGDLGAYRLLHELPPVLDALSAEPVRFPEKSENRDIWDRWWVLCLLTGLLAIEWVLRKRFRLQ